MAIQVSPLPTIPAGPVEVAIVASTISPDDFRSRHKTSDRAFHDAPRKAAGPFEIAFVAAHGFLTEGRFPSMFVERGDPLGPPPLTPGLLNRDKRRARQRW